jgi:CheY-like chemotaxis protein
MLYIEARYIETRYIEERRQAMSTHPPIPKTALVVDDSMLIRHSVCRFLEERGFIVESATNGIEALAVLTNFVPDIIITDLSMPRMGGVELVSRIRKLEVFADTPILVLAARSSATELFNELPSGAAAVIFKDIDIEAQLGRALATTLA